MGHTITIHLTDDAQREALLEGAPATRAQTYYVPAELLPRLLALPWTAVSDSGEATCTVPIRLGSGYSEVSGAADSRPVDAEAAIAHAEAVVEEHREAVETAKRHAAERAAEDRTRAERWAALPLDWRVTPEGYLAHCSTEARYDWDGPLVYTGYTVVGYDVLRAHVPAAVAEAEAEAKRRRLAPQLAEQAERVRWAREHGSARLRGLLEEGIECGAVYRDERLALERPGWRWERDVYGTGNDPRNAPVEALDLLREARASLPEEERASAVLRYWVIEEGHDRDGERIDGWRGYAVIAPYLGTEIVYGGPREE
ncbi:MAG: hypothetical protein ACE15D_18605 [Candidatus Eisenbacteria bacterium]